MRARAAAVSWLTSGRRAALHAGLLGVEHRAASASNSKKKPFSSKTGVSDGSLKARDPGSVSNPIPLVIPFRFTRRDSCDEPGPVAYAAQPAAIDVAERRSPP